MCVYCVQGRPLHAFSTVLWLLCDSATNHAVTWSVCLCVYSQVYINDFYLSTTIIAIVVHCAIDENDDVILARRHLDDVTNCFR